MIMNNEQKNCFACGCNINEKDVVALSRKLFGENVRKFFCLPCLADSLGVEVDELLAKIEEFKAEGCKLFG